MEINIGKSGTEDIFLSAQELVTGRTCIVAQSGAGKSWTLAVICEQLLESNIPFCVIDTEGEYNSLRQKFKILWVGGKKADIDIEKVDLEKLAEKVIGESIPLIFDVSDVIDQKKLVSEFTEKIYNIEDRLREPYLLIIEEADKFVPQSRESMEQLEEIARRGRKRGLGLMLATQRPAMINKNILSQCSNQIIGKLTTENDLKAVDLFFASRKDLEEIPNLETGEFFIMGNIVRGKKKIKVRDRVTQHKGTTPKLVPKDFKKIDFKDLIKEYASGSLEVKQIKIKMLKPEISRKKAYEIASDTRKKKFVLFGDYEKIKLMELNAHPMINIQLENREGFIRKKTMRYSFVVDGITGNIISFKDGIVYHPGFEKIVDLSRNEVIILFEVNRSPKDIQEIKYNVKLSDKNISAALNKLEKLNLITKEKKKDKKIYSIIDKIKIPNIKHFDEIRVEDIMIPAKQVEFIIDKKDIESIVSAFMLNSKIIKFEKFYYPVYSVSFEKRIIKIDGVSGRIL